MTDYYAALKSAIERLDRNSAEARYNFYDNAREVLDQGLGTADPPPPASEVSRQKQELEDAIRRLEREISAGVKDTGRRRPQGQAETGRSAGAGDTARRRQQRQAETGRGGTEKRPAHRSGEDRRRPSTAPAPDAALRANRRWTEDSNAGGTDRPSRRSPVPTILLIAVIVGAALALGILAWSQRSVIAGLFSPSDGAPTEVAAPEPAPPPPDTASSPTADAASPPTADATAQPPPVTEGVAVGGLKAMLIEAEAPDVARTSGDTVIPATINWQLVEDGAEGPEIRADLNVLARGMTVNLVIRRNTDPNLPASHLIEVTTDTPAEFPGKGIRNVPGLALKPGEKEAGEPLSAAAVPVADGIFWIAPYTTEPEVSRNLWLLKERPWIDLPMVYESGQRAILTFEKGQEGTEIFNRAFAAWEQE